MTETWKQCEGQVVDGKFHLRQYLGGSDHSAVFLADFDQHEPRQAAIKFIPANPESLEIQISRWQRAVKLSHPHLIQIFHQGQCQLGGRELLFVVMEYAEENLAQILPHRPLTPDEARDMLSPVLDVLAYIHKQGFVHGHLRPSNIMAVSDQLKLSSDGLCAVGEHAEGLQEPSVYNAPEIATGLTPASDIWSLGMTLVEVLTQHPLLWDGAEQREPVIPETMPPPFRSIASHCLRQDPQLRWTVAEIAASLHPSPQHSAKPIAAVPSPHSTDSGSSRPLTKSRFIGPIVGAAILLLAIVAGPKLFNHRRGPEQISSRAVPSSIPTSSKPSTEENQKTAVTETTTPAQTSSSDRPAKTSASGSASGSVVQQVLPDVSQSARSTVQGRIKIRVRVDVDSTGSVVGAKFESAGPSKYFANKTLAAARQWKFTPPQVDGQAVASEWVLKFSITKTSTTVQPIQAKPKL